jgi:hypothetical protein
MARRRRTQVTANQLGLEPENCIIISPTQLLADELVAIELVAIVEWGIGML